MFDKQPYNSLQQLNNSATFSQAFLHMVCTAFHLVFIRQSCWCTKNERGDTSHVLQTSGNSYSSRIKKKWILEQSVNDRLQKTSPAQSHSQKCYRVLLQRGGTKRSLVSLGDLKKKRIYNFYTPTTKDGIAPHTAYCDYLM